MRGGETINQEETWKKLERHEAEGVLFLVHRRIKGLG